MDVNGCQIVSTPNADSPDGFASMVSKASITPDCTPANPSIVSRVERGPFMQIKNAIHYAMSWGNVTTPPPVPTEVVAVEEMAFENITDELDKPVE